MIPNINNIFQNLSNTFISALQEGMVPIIYKYIFTYTYVSTYINK